MSALAILGIVVGCAAGYTAIGASVYGYLGADWRGPYGMPSSVPAGFWPIAVVWLLLRAPARIGCRAGLALATRHDRKQLPEAKVLR